MALKMQTHMVTVAASCSLVWVRMLCDFRGDGSRSESFSVSQLNV
uniref:Uncharacterized protein n=1 Tax=Anguilla anguilla TaxID=7936 RepID=A0A0E9RNU2_ANGAN